MTIISYNTFGKHREYKKKEKTANWPKVDIFRQVAVGPSPLIYVLFHW